MTDRDPVDRDFLPFFRAAYSGYREQLLAETDGHGRPKRARAQPHQLPADAEPLLKTVRLVARHPHVASALGAAHLDPDRLVELAFAALARAYKRFDGKRRWKESGDRGASFTGLFREILTEKFLLAARRARRSAQKAREARRGWRHRRGTAEPAGPYQTWGLRLWAIARPADGRLKEFVERTIDGEDRKDIARSWGIHHNTLTKKYGGRNAEGENAAGRATEAARQAVHGMVGRLAENELLDLARLMRHDGVSPDEIAALLGREVVILDDNAPPDEAAVVAALRRAAHAPGNRAA